MNTFVLAGILMAALIAATESANINPIAKVGSKTFYTIEGKETVSWSEALDACSFGGLSMTRIENKEQNRALSAYLRNLSPEDSSKSGGLMWLGASLYDGKWTWSNNGDELTYKNWRKDAVLNNPGDYIDGNNPTNGYGCGYINGGGKWGTWPCNADNKAIVVCQ